MSKYYIGGVANVDAFTDDGSGNPKHLFSAKTLTDSSINISVSNEEIRGGEGAQLLGKFFHTTVFNLSLTDALFDLNYIGQQVGSQIKSGSTVVMETVKLVGGDGVEDPTIIGTVGTIKTTEGKPVPMDFGGLYSSETICWDANNRQYKITKAGDNYQITVEEGTTELCVTVPVSKTGDQVQVNAMYYPSIFSLNMRAKLFLGDACKASDGKPAGEIVIEIPKFQLDGTVDLAMAMTSPATYSLNGSALANGCGCGSDAWYAKITEVIAGADPYAGYTGIVVDTDTIAKNMPIGVYAFAIGKTPKALSPDQFNSSDPSVINAAGYVVNNGSTILSINNASAPINTSAIKSETVTVNVSGLSAS